MNRIALTASPDAELLDLLERVEAADRESRRLEKTWTETSMSDEGYRKAEKAAVKALLRFHRLVRRACVVRAYTEAGKAAKARLLQSVNCYVMPDGSVPPWADMLVHVAHSLSLDMAGPPPRHG